MKIDPETDCSRWYQIIRPVSLGFHARKPPEVRPLDLAGECNAKCWSKIPLQLAKHPRKREFYSFIQSPDDEYLKELGKTGLSEDIASRRKQCRLCSDKNDQKDDLDETLWHSVGPAYSECAEKSNIEAIKAFLDKRRNGLERRIQEDGGTLFVKYGLGSHAGNFERDGKLPYSNDDQLMNKFDNLFKLIDRMANERIKPAFQGVDVFDKSKPITGKVGFWRDEINGIRELTDFDEALDFGDLVDDANFKSYLVKKGRGRFDSKGNFISSSEDALPCEEDETSGANHDGEIGKWSEKGTRSRVKSTTNHGLVDRKPRKYPNWEFPMCNYPRWVHQMYRMDQMKVGQLIKQGSGAPRYCSTWTVCRDQNKTRGKSEATLRTEASSRNKLDLRSSNEDADDEVGGFKRRKHSKVQGQVKGKLGQNEAKRNMNYEKISKASSFDLNKFLESYEKEQLELSKLETDSNGQIIQKDEYQDITDLIDEYHRKLREEDDLLKGEALLRRRAEEKDQMIKRKQAAAREALAKLKMKKLQEAVLKQQELHEKESFAKNKESMRRSTKYSAKSSAILFKLDGDGRTAKRRPPPTLVCRRLKSWPIDLVKEMECLDRFNVLLESQSDVGMSRDKFIELVKQIPVVQSAPTKKLTPCEKLKPEVVNGLE